MNNKERAKQFMPFDAMKGLKEALRVKEERRTRVERKQLSEDMAKELSDSLSNMREGSCVRICFYFRGHYIDIEGFIAEINTAASYIRIGNECIYFSDILRAEIL